MQEKGNTPNNVPQGEEGKSENTDLSMAKNPNPRANENIRDTPMENNTGRESTTSVGSEITDGEAG